MPLLTLWLMSGIAAAVTLTACSSGRQGDVPMSPKPLKRIVFVCVENSNRSQMAEAFARIHGAGEVEAISAGSRPSGRINPLAVEAMREIGYDLSCHQSKSLDAIPAGEYAVAVTIGCGDSCPLVQAR